MRILISLMKRIFPIWRLRLLSSNSYASVGLRFSGASTFSLSNSSWHVVKRIRRKLSFESPCSFGGLRLISKQNLAYIGQKIAWWTAISKRILMTARKISPLDILRSWNFAKSFSNVWGASLFRMLRRQSFAHLQNETSPFAEPDARIRHRWRHSVYKTR
eukprot:19909_2